MFKFIIIFFTLLDCSLQITIGKQVLFMTGEERNNANTDLITHVVSLRHKFRDNALFGAGHFCGGTIVSDRAILTAAHCFYDSDGYMRSTRTLIAVAGTVHRIEKMQSAKVYEVVKVIIHDDYNYKYKWHDIAIVIVKNNIDFNEQIKVASLPNVAPKNQTVCTVFGWGKIFENGPLTDILNFADLVVQSPDTCLQTFNYFSADGMICAMSKPFEPGIDACSGDSGGPLFCNNSIAGIISFGLGCGRKGIPAGYTNVHFYTDWILKNCACVTVKPFVLIVILLVNLQLV